MKQNSQLFKQFLFSQISRRCTVCFDLSQQQSFAERLKREEQSRLEQEKWRRRMESESVEAQEQLSDLGMLAAELRGSLSQKEKEITTLQGR